MFHRRNHNAVAYVLGGVNCRPTYHLVKQEIVRMGIPGNLFALNPIVQWHRCTFGARLHALDCEHQHSQQVCLWSRLRHGKGRYGLGGGAGNRHKEVACPPPSEVKAPPQRPEPMTTWMGQTARGACISVRRRDWLVRRPDITQRRLSPCLKHGEKKHWHIVWPQNVWHVLNIKAWSRVTPC